MGRSELEQNSTAHPHMAVSIQYAKTIAAQLITSANYETKVVGKHHNYKLICTMGPRG